jgi:DNA-binding MarR family transcriptional regulator
MSEDTKLVGTYLTAEGQAELEAIKRYHGIRSNAEILRSLVTKEARAIREGIPLFATQEAQ